MNKEQEKFFDGIFEKVFGKAPVHINIGKYLDQLDRIERLLKFLICRMPYITFNDVRIEDAPDISDIFEEKK